jgi:HPt (histidine-containing phosphotransfer) domain-containing protein
MPVKVKGSQFSIEAGWSETPPTPGGLLDMASKSPPKPRPNKKPWPKVTREPASDAVSTIAHGFGSTWSQAELGDAFDIQALSVIGDLDPTGVRGVVKEVLSLFQNSLEPLLAKLEQLRAADSAAGILFEAHKLKSAAGQIGAMRLSAACAAITKHFNGRTPNKSDSIDRRLDALADIVVAETIRVQRELRRLLASED